MGRSKRRARERSCRGKRRFATMKEARAAAASLARRRAQQGNTIVAYLRAYGCACGGFHFGSTRDLDWSLVPGLGGGQTMR